MAKLPYLVEGAALQPQGWEVYWVVKSREWGNDAFCLPLHRAINDTLELCPQGFIAALLRRLAQDQNQAALSSQDGYPHKLIVGVVNGESTHEGRMEAMSVIKEVSVKIW